VTSCLKAVAEKKGPTHMSSDSVVMKYSASEHGDCGRWTTMSIYMAYNIDGSCE
jgi:hypothetical protein